MMNMMRWTLLVLLITAVTVASYSGLPPSPTPFDSPTSLDSPSPTTWPSDDDGCIDSYAGDGYCDTENNTEDCDYDGGDCCECDCNDGAYYDCGAYSVYACNDPDSDCFGSDEEVTDVETPLTREELADIMDNDGLTKTEEVALAVGAGLFATIFGGICLFWYQKKYS